MPRPARPPAGASTPNGRDELERLARLRRQLVEVGLVLAREDDALQAGALCSERLLAQSADGQHLPRQRDLSGHPDVWRYGLAEDERRDRRRHRHAGGLAVLGHGPGGNEDKNVVLFEPVLGKPDLVGV